MTDQATTSYAQEAYFGILNGAEAPEPERLLDLFSQLEPVSVDSMIGLWLWPHSVGPPAIPSPSSLPKVRYPSRRALASASCTASASCLATMPSRSSVSPMIWLARRVGRLRRRPPTRAFVSRYGQRRDGVRPATLDRLLPQTRRPYPCGHDRDEGQADGHRFLHAAGLTRPRRRSDGDEEAGAQKSSGQTGFIRPAGTRRRVGTGAYSKWLARDRSEAGRDR